ncbi:MAG: hypothetical protein J7K02_03430 [Deltaproteobacteria bacterium]|nr:hypothetical protein [Deltaproteobacteria bacterium]
MDARLRLPVRHACAVARQAGVRTQTGESGNLIGQYLSVSKEANPIY